jgi:hypothetical protein
VGITLFSRELKNLAYLFLKEIIETFPHTHLYFILKYIAGGESLVILSLKGKN